MKRTMVRGFCAAYLIIGVAAGSPLWAQTTAGPQMRGKEMASPNATSPELRRYRQMSEIMRDMTNEMNKMTEEMAKHDVTPEMRKRMTVRMNEMSAMMKRMAGLQDRSSMKEHDAQKHTEEMRRQMDAMMKDPAMLPKK